jgi:hypothetical protein
MKYAKPEVEVLASATEAIQMQSKKGGHTDSLVTQPTINAYEADE